MTDALLAELATVLGRTDPVPPSVVDDAESAFTLGFLPPGWTLLDPLPDLALIRSAARSLRFQDNEFSVHIELRDARLSGLITPLSELEVRWPTGSVWIRPDVHGFFLVDNLPRGPLRLVIETRATRWFST